MVLHSGRDFGSGAVDKLFDDVASPLDIVDMEKRLFKLFIKELNPDVKRLCIVSRYSNFIIFT